jgi:alkylhydroperoxidase family enzyme
VDKQSISTTGLSPASPTALWAAELGMDQEMLGELMAIVGLFNMTNSLANGYQVEPDIWPPQD